MHKILQIAVVGLAWAHDLLLCYLNCRMQWAWILLFAQPYLLGILWSWLMQASVQSSCVLWFPERSTIVDSIKLAIKPILIMHVELYMSIYKVQNCSPNASFLSPQMNVSGPNYVRWGFSPNSTLLFTTLHIKSWAKCYSSPGTTAYTLPLGSGTIIYAGNSR